MNRRLSTRLAWVAWSGGTRGILSALFARRPERAVRRFRGNRCGRRRRGRAPRRNRPPRQCPRALVRQAQGEDLLREGSGEKLKETRFLLTLSRLRERVG